MREPTLHDLISECHHDMILAGHWEEAAARHPPDDSWQLALLGDLVVAVGALCDWQRKTGALLPENLAAVGERLATLRRAAQRGAITPYARRGIDGLREKDALLPRDGMQAHLLRQLLHLHIEVGETIAANRAEDYRAGETTTEELADIALVLCDLFGALPAITQTIRRKQARNRYRGRHYGRPPTREQTNCASPLSAAAASATMEGAPMPTDPTPAPDDASAASADEEPLAKIHHSRPLAKRRVAPDEEETPLGGWTATDPLAKAAGEK